MTRNAPAIQAYNSLSILRVMLTGLIGIMLTACAHQPATPSLYDSLGQKTGIENIVSRLIYEIGDDPTIRPYFEDSDLDRFHEKLSEQICEVSGGPCTYSGDSMVDVHTRMNVNEADFNRLVDLLIAAMDHQKIPHPTQNRLLSILAPMRGDIIYR
ncbi:group I truncated hemoglobin [Hahella ganghwensis]|uniref:group I truncated hemoglobin n=1 Tax=Hahella ganghwensis TaxID=286420 RepID=UPI0003742A42|nr:group 1 truncated hemoglobin [Hahella ganghwensis]